MMPPNPRVIFDRDQKFARDTIIQCGHLLPMFVIHGHDGEIVPLLISGFGAETREHAYRLVQIACVAHDAAAVAMMSEAWMAHQLTSEPVTRLPSEREDRVEVVSVQLAAKDPDTGEVSRFASVREIVRDSAGGIVDLLPDTRSVQDSIDGFLFHLLPDFRPTRTEQEAAKKVLQSVTGQPS